MIETESKTEFRDYLPAISALILLNLLLSGLKLWVGYVGESSSMRSVGWNNLADLLYSTLLAVGLWISVQPADSSHPEGHGRFESLVGLLVSVVILLTGLFVVWDAYQAFYGEQMMQVGRWGIGLIVGSMVLKSLISWFLMNRGRALESSALEAIGIDQAGDVLADGTVIVAIVASYFDVGWLDPTVAFVIGLFILKIGLEPFRENIDYLTGKTGPQELYERIEQIVLEDPQFEAVKNIRAHHVGPSFHVSLTVSAPGSMSLEEIHRVEEQLKDKIYQEDRVSRVYVHVEPSAEF